MDEYLKTNLLRLKKYLATTGDRTHGYVDDIDEATELINKLEEQNKRLVEAIDHEMVIRHLGVFNRGDDPVDALRTIAQYDCDLGAYFAKQEINDE